MTAILTIIDGFLSLPVVRWLLLAATVAALATATWCKLQIGTVRLQRDAAKGQSATYEAHLNLQNAAIIKQGADMEKLLKKLQTATASVEQEREKLKKRQIEVREVILQGPCPDMVQRVLDEVRK